MQLVTRLTAVRGALQDHLEDHPLVFEGVAAVLHFVSQICKKLKATILGEGSGPLQELLVQVCYCYFISVKPPMRCRCTSAQDDVRVLRHMNHKQQVATDSLPDTEVCLQEVGTRLHEVDIAKHFTPTSFENKIKQMNGYQSHIVSPEIALRALISDAFADVAPIAQWMVVAVRTFLSQQAKEAANGVVEDDPDHRQQLADLIVQVRKWPAQAHPFNALLCTAAGGHKGMQRFATSVWPTVHLESPVIIAAAQIALPLGM